MTQVELRDASMMEQRASAPDRDAVEQDHNVETVHWIVLAGAKQHPTPRSGWQDLSSDLVVYIMGYLDIKSLLCTASVCRWVGASLVRRVFCIRCIG